ncbi:MAG: hypothetical protein U9O98_04180 [Asgard group archaeon]|nr:hypothetical protein [Asgard group archaeon]
MENKRLQAYLEAGGTYLNYRWKYYKQTLFYGITIFLLAVLALISGIFIILEDLLPGIILLLISIFCLVIGSLFFRSFIQAKRAYNYVKDLKKQEDKQTLLQQLDSETISNLYDQQVAFFSLCALIDLQEKDLIPLLKIMLEEANETNRKKTMLQESFSVLAYFEGYETSTDFLEDYE